MILLAFVEGGHGLETKGKETPLVPDLKRRIKENEFNDAVVELLCGELDRHNISVYDVAPGHTDIPLKTRVDKANEIYANYVKKYGRENVNAVYVSIHFNAFDGTFEGRNPSGFSVHIQPTDAKKKSAQLGKLILEELALGTKQINRGLVLQNLYVTRETDVPACLVECGFMDNPDEVKLMLDKDFHAEVAREVTTGILRYFGKRYVKPIEKPKATESKELYRVQVGAFSNRENAEKMVAKAKSLGLDAFVVKG